MTYEAGDVLNESLRKALALPENVEVDFAGTRVHMSPYFNASIAALLADYTLADLRQRLVIKNLPEQSVKTLQRCMDVAGEYYAKPEVRLRLESMLEAHACD